MLRALGSYWYNPPVLFVAGETEFYCGTDGRSRLGHLAPAWCRLAGWHSSTLRGCGAIARVLLARHGGLPRNAGTLTLISRWLADRRVGTSLAYDDRWRRFRRVSAAECEPIPRVD
jgi:hypothetical protein